MIEHWDHEETIRLVVADLFSHYRQYVLREDLAQEAMVWWYGPGQEYLPEYLTDENLVRLRRSIWRFVVKFCETEEAHARGYEAIDQAFYQAAEILRFMPLALDPEAMPQLVALVDENSGIRQHGNLAEGGNALATLIDVRRALDALPDDDVFYLNVCDALGYDYERVGNYTDTLADSARRRHARIAERMARWLNKKEYRAA